MMLFCNKPEVNTDKEYVMKPQQSEVKHPNLSPEKVSIKDFQNTTPKHEPSIQNSPTKVRELTPVKFYLNKDEYSDRTRSIPNFSQQMVFQSFQNQNQQPNLLQQSPLQGSIIPNQPAQTIISPVKQNRISYYAPNYKNIGYPKDLANTMPPGQYGSPFIVRDNRSISPIYQSSAPLQNRNVTPTKSVYNGYGNYSLNGESEKRNQQSNQRMAQQCFPSPNNSQPILQKQIINQMQQYQANPNINNSPVKQVQSRQYMIQKTSDFNINNSNNKPQQENYSLKPESISNRQQESDGNLSKLFEKVQNQLSEIKQKHMLRNQQREERGDSYNMNDFDRHIENINLNQNQNRNEDESSHMSFGKQDQ